MIDIAAVTARRTSDAFTVGVAIGPHREAIRELRFDTVTASWLGVTMVDEDSPVIARYIAAYNDSRYEDLRALVAPSYVHHSGPADLSFDGFCRGASWIRSGLPDFHVVVHDQLTDGDRTALRFTGHGTHTGSFDGETPTGRSVTVYGATVFRLADGLIAEDWETLDEQPFRDLLGGG